MLSQQIAKHFRDVWFGGNWTDSNFRDQLQDVSLVEATRQLGTLNTLATLVFHSIYYVHGVTEVFRGHPLSISDKFAFAHPDFADEAVWQGFLNDTWAAAETFAEQLAAQPDDYWFADFTKPEYGSNFRNVVGIIEHSHYHLGQIVVLKKLLRSGVPGVDVP